MDTSSNCFDSGETRQYMDGVLVNSNFYPNGSVNNFDLYKIGVNRAGNSHFQGLIDNVMIWDTALRNSSITVLNREYLGQLFLIFWKRSRRCISRDDS